MRKTAGWRRAFTRRSYRPNASPTPILPRLTALKIGLPWVTAEYEATVAIMGEDFWSYGL